MIGESNPELLRTEFGRRIHDLVKSGALLEAFNLWGSGMVARQDPRAGNDALTQSIWERLTTSAEKFNQPGVFTALIGYEWSSVPGGSRLHAGLGCVGERGSTLVFGAKMRLVGCGNCLVYSELLECARQDSNL